MFERESKNSIQKNPEPMTDFLTETNQHRSVLDKAPDLGVSVVHAAQGKIQDPLPMPFVKPKHWVPKPLPAPPPEQPERVLDPNNPPPLPVIPERQQPVQRAVPPPPSLVRPLSETAVGITVCGALTGVFDHMLRHGDFRGIPGSSLKGASLGLGAGALSMSSGYMLDTLVSGKTPSVSASQLIIDGFVVPQLMLTPLPWRYKAAAAGLTFALSRGLVYYREYQAK